MQIILFSLFLLLLDSCSPGLLWKTRGMCHKASPAWSLWFTCLHQVTLAILGEPVTQSWLSTGSVKSDLSIPALSTFMWKRSWLQAVTFTFLTTLSTYSNMMWDEPICTCTLLKMISFFSIIFYYSGFCLIIKTFLSSDFPQTTNSGHTVLLVVLKI